MKSDTIKTNRDSRSIVDFLAHGMMEGQRGVRAGERGRRAGEVGGRAFWVKGGE